jgi:iron complex outermembrane recepter protein
MVERSTTFRVFAAAATVGLPLLASNASAQSEDSGVLQEVTVTAQFRKENMQSTPIAITAVSAEMLEARNQTNVQQIANQAPNVTLKAAGTSTGPSLIGFIRGVGQTDFNPAMEPGVGLYVDDVYYSTLTGSVLDLLDLSRVAAGHAGRQELDRWLDQAVYGRTHWQERGVPRSGVR